MWTLAPEPLEDELLSSWLLRWAMRTGCDPLVLTGAIWPTWRAWSVDVDRSLSEERIQQLSCRTQLDLERIGGLTVKPISSGVMKGGSQTTWPWLLTLGARNRRRMSGLQYCPVCLSHDCVPYYRRRWRMAWNTVCCVHAVVLLDQCPHCSAPVQPHKLSSEDADVGLCSSCKKSLSDIVPVCADRMRLALQDCFERADAGQQVSVPFDHLVNEEWFDVMRHFVGLLRSPSLNRSLRFQSFLAMCGINLHARVIPASGLPFELLPVGERSRLLGGAWTMLQNPKSRLIEFASKSGVTGKMLLGIGQTTHPKSIVEIAECLSNGSSRSGVKRSSGIPRPRSRHAVRRMLVLLQRRQACQR